MYNQIKSNSNVVDYFEKQYSKEENQKNSVFIDYFKDTIENKEKKQLNKII